MTTPSFSLLLYFLFFSRSCAAPTVRGISWYNLSLIVCSYHVTYAFQSGSTLYSCLNVKEFLSQSSSEIWRLSDCNWTRSHNHLVCKQTLNHLAKLAKCLVFVCEISVCRLKSHHCQMLVFFQRTREIVFVYKTCFNKNDSIGDKNFINVWNSC